jgi:hypothetical protein
LKLHLIFVVEGTCIYSGVERTLKLFSSGLEALKRLSLKRRGQSTHCFQEEESRELFCKQPFFFFKLNDFRGATASAAVIVRIALRSSAAF